MLERISAFLKKSTTTWQSWRMQKQLASAEGFCSIMVSPQEVSLLYATQGSPHMVIKVCETVKLTKGTSISTALSSLVEKHQLKFSPCIWVLDQKDYQLFHMELLPVPANEFQSAIRWKLKGSLMFNIDDAMIDKFNMPTPKIQNAQQMMTVVATKESYISGVVSQIKESGLILNVIDIPELALRNITACFETDDQTSALLNLAPNAGQLVITRKSELYFSRRIDFDFNAFMTSAADETKLLEKLALEIQRSFDYFHTQWRSQFPDRVFIVTPKLENIKITEVLSSYLGMPVLELPISSLLTNQSNVPLEYNPSVLPLVGGLIREEMMHATRN